MPAASIAGTTTGLQAQRQTEVGCEVVYPTCCTLSSTTRSLASSLESSWKQSSMSPEDTVSREWLGGNTRLKRLFSTWGEGAPHKDRGGVRVVLS